MKKVLLPLFAISVLATSCADKNAYTITGHVANSDYDSTYVFLKAIPEDMSQEAETIDSALVLNGTFAFKGLAPKIANQSLVFAQKENDYYPRQVNFVAEPGNIKITIDSVQTVKGTPKNDEVQTFITKLQSLDESKMKIIGKFETNPELESDLEKQIETIDKEEKDTYFNFVKSNINNSLGVYNFQMLATFFSVDNIKELMSSLTEEQKNYKSITSIQKYIDATENTVVGKKYIDIKAEDPNGNKVALSDFVGKNKYVLIDFWASWCGPCRKDMPEVAELYKKYKNKGLEIVGFSLDQDEKSWLDGIKELNLTWPQMSELRKSTGPEAASSYAIISIPHTILIDQEGTIIARELRGEDLANKLAELMK